MASTMHTLSGMFKEIYADDMSKLIYGSNPFLSKIALTPYNEMCYEGEKIICSHFENQLMDVPKQTKHLVSWEE